MSHQPQLIPEEPTPEQAARDAERAEYLEWLRERLQDTEFRDIEDFPIGEDEDILALSDPPYHTACPNPVLPEIIAHWQKERAALREELGFPDDSHDNGAHPISPRDLPRILPGMKHWRSWLPSAYFCIHAMAPLMYITDTVPIKDNG
jgi:hypothetical protein